MSSLQRYVAVLADEIGNVLTPSETIARLVLASKSSAGKKGGNTKGQKKQAVAGNDASAQSYYDKLVLDSGIQTDVLKAIIKVESGSYPFINDRIVVRFEPHIFNRLYVKKVLGKKRITSSDRKNYGKTVLLPGMRVPTGVKVEKTGKLGCKIVIGYDVKSGDGLTRFSDSKRNFAQRQSVEYEALNMAASIDYDLAHQSTSFGLGQIMGFNYAYAGYKSAREMANAFQLSAWNQRAGIVSFILAYPVKDSVTGKTVLQSARDIDFEAFARVYNGDKTGTYASRMKEKYRPKVGV
jgi:hypothetical protein